MRQPSGVPLPGGGSKFVPHGCFGDSGITAEELLGLIRDELLRASCITGWKRA